MPPKPRRGAPPGLRLNPVAAKHHLADRPQSWLAVEAAISTAQLSLMLKGTKGASRSTADALASALRVPVELLFPQLVGFGTEVRVFTATDDVDAAA